jgi:hypothetical protein
VDQSAETRRWSRYSVKKALSVLKGFFSLRLFVGNNYFVSSVTVKPN